MIQRRHCILALVLLAIIVDDVMAQRGVDPSMPSGGSGDGGLLCFGVCLLAVGVWAACVHFKEASERASRKRDVEVRAETERKNKIQHLNLQSLLEQSGCRVRVPKGVTDGNELMVKIASGEIISGVILFAEKQQVISALLSLGAEINRADSSGDTVLHAAALRGHVKLVPFLIDQGADVNARGFKERTPLHCLVNGLWSSHLAPITALLDAGADINARERDGWTALHFVAAQDRMTDQILPELLMTLLRRGADASIKNAEGRTALDLAKKSSDLKGTQAMKALEEVTHRGELSEIDGSDEEVCDPFVEAADEDLVLPVRSLTHDVEAKVQSYRCVCWGSNYCGPCDVPAGKRFTQMAAGNVHAVGLLEDGSPIVWGNNVYGQCDVPAGERFTKVVAGGCHSIGLRADGTAIAWGYNEYGQCDVPAGKKFTQVAAGNWNSLGLQPDGTAIAWGHKKYGERRIPSGEFTQIAAGYNNAIALRPDGTACAWGGSDFIVGDHCKVPSGYTFVQVAARNMLSIGLTADGTVVQWGSSRAAQSAPSGERFSQVVAGGHLTIGIRPDGTAIAWGYNENGERDVPADEQFVQIAIGGKWVAGLVLD